MLDVARLCRVIALPVTLSAVAAITSTFSLPDRNAATATGVYPSGVVIPKSVHEARMTENAQIFDFALDADEMHALSALETNQTQRSYMPGYRWEA